MGDRLNDADRAVVQRRIAPDQKGAAFAVLQIFTDQALEYGPLIPIEVGDRRAVIDAAAFPLRAAGVDKAVIAVVDVPSAELPAKLDQFFLAGAFVENKKDVCLVEGVDRLDRQVFGIAGTDADDQDLLHRKPL